MKRFFTLLIGLIAIVGTAGADDSYRIVGGFSGSWAWDGNSEWELTQNPKNTKLWTLYKSWTATSNSIEFKALSSSNTWIPDGANVSATFTSGTTYDLFFILDTDNSTLKLITNENVTIKGDWNTWTSGSGDVSMSSSGITYSETIDLSSTTSALNFKIFVNYKGSSDEVYLGYDNSVSIIKGSDLIYDGGAPNHNFMFLENLVKGYSKFTLNVSWSLDDGLPSTGSAWKLSVTPSEERGGYSKVLFKNTSNWPNVYAYSWTGESYNASYPGEQLTKIDGYYAYFYATAYEKIIFGNNNESQKTEDLEFVADRIYNTSGPISQTVSINSYGVATYCSPDPLDFSTATPSGLTAYRIYDPSNGSLSKEALTKVPANTGVYVEGTASTDYTVYATASATTIGTNKLVGVTSTTAISQTDGSNTNYILTVNTANGNVDTPKFYKVHDNGNTVLANRAYLQIPTGSDARESLWFDDDETTSVNALDTQLSSLDQMQPIFNLAGQRVDNSYKGVIIQNGKKHIVK